MFWLALLKVNQLKKWAEINHKIPVPALDSFPDLGIPHVTRINYTAANLLVRIMFTEKVKVVYDGVKSSIWGLKLNRLLKLIPLAK